MNRIEPVIGEIKSEFNVRDRMELITYALNDTVTPIPEVGNLCTFYYYAKTPGIEYDQHPLVCLLYTSPSPRDLSTSRMPSSA